jgi:hypothetical protein
MKSGIRAITHTMALFFSSYFLKPSVMPNQGNKSNGSSDVVKKKKNPTMPSTHKEGSGDNATEQGNSKSQKSNAGNTTNSGSKKGAGSSE